MVLPNGKNIMRKQRKYSRVVGSMKKGILHIILICMVLSFAGCTQLTNKGDTPSSDPVISDISISETETTGGNQDTELNSVIGENLKYSVQEQIISSDRVKVSYPEFEFENKALSEETNESILRSVTMIMETTNIDEYEEAEFSYEVCAVKENVISVVFSGFMFETDAAYPINAFFSFNISPKTGMLIKNGDLITFDSAFVEKLKSSDAVYKNEDVRDVASDLDSEEFIKNIDNYFASLNSDRYSFYFTESSVGVSIPLPHVAGDHTEIEVAYDKLN